jgi:hypothetical protein
MIRDVDESLQSWFGTLLPGVTVTFDAPGSPLPADGSATVRLFLADLREEDDFTTDTWTPLRDERGVVVGRLPAARRYRFAYLVMAEAADTLTEHAVLGQLLQATARAATLPTEHLSGDLANEGRVVVLRCAPERRFSDPTHLWQAWGVPPRLALELWLMASLPVTPAYDAAPPPEEIALSSRRSATVPRLEEPKDGARRPRARIDEG